jgi:hypothetical protein
LGLWNWGVGVLKASLQKFFRLQQATGGFFLTHFKPPKRLE